MADPVTATAIAVGTGLISAKAQYDTGKIQQRMYNIKARQARIRADQEANIERQKGIAVLEKIGATLATINARAGAGAIDPYSGTPQGLRVFATAEGMQDFTVTRENAAMIENIGILQEIDNRQAGSMAAYQGRIGALTTLGQTALAAYQIGGAPSNVGGFAGGGSIGGAIDNTLYPTASSIGSPSMLP